MPLGRSFLRRAATAGALAVALTAGAVTPATAQDDPLDLSFLGEDGLALVMGSLGVLPVGSTANMLGSVGSSDIPLGTGSTEATGTPSQVDESINTVEVVAVEERGAYEYWTVSSVAMKRLVRVEVVKSRITDQGPAPVMYMLDGVGAPYDTTGWNHVADIDEMMEGENVHIVNPAGAFASYYADWEREDPVLGNHKWETFLTEELPGLVDARLDTNGKSAIAGVSMGAQAAMHLAATYDMYDAVMAFSGNYSTMDELGYQTIRLSVETRGGDLDNMWGERGSERWEEHDTISHPEGLDGKSVFFTAGTGVIGEDDPGEYGGRVDSMMIGIVLERGVHEASKAFEKALKSKGIDHKVMYSPTGLHNWANFLRYFDEGWDYIKGDLGL